MELLNISHYVDFGTQAYVLEKSNKDFLNSKTISLASYCNVELNSAAFQVTFYRNTHRNTQIHDSQLISYHTITLEVKFLERYNHLNL